MPAQFEVIGRWLDGSVKWLLLDFQSSQAAAGTAEFKLGLSGRKQKPLVPLARKAGENVEVDTGPMKVVFGKQKVLVQVGGKEIAGGEVVSRIGVRKRDDDSPTQFRLHLSNPSIETNGFMRSVLKVEGWHRSDDGDRFSPSVVRMTFYRGRKFIRIHHTFVISKNPDTHVISDIGVRWPLKAEMKRASWSLSGASKTSAIGAQRFSVFQENTARASYPPVSPEFSGRFRVFNGRQVISEGRRYPGGLVLRGEDAGVGVFLRNMWQMCPKALAYHDRTLHVGLWPGELAGELDLKRTEMKNPKHFQDFAAKDPSYRHPKYNPMKYVSHTLEHSAMGVSRTHEFVIWFEREPEKLDPGRLAGLFDMPFVPFVSGEWNVRTGVMGKQVLPGAYRPEIEGVNRAMMAEARNVMERWGWYGMLEYGNFRYAFRKTHMRWFNYHPKYAWYNSGHLMGGGTMLQALWFQYLRSGDPLDFLVAEARGLNKMDVSTVHYHERDFVGNMIRHGGYDPWVGARRPHGAHAPLAGIPIHYYATGSQRASDLFHLIATTNYRHRDFTQGRNTDTNINTMMLYYQHTLDRQYYDRAVEFIDYYHRNLEETGKRLTFFDYFTTAMRNFYPIAGREVRKKIKETFEAKKQTRLQRGGLNPEMAAFAWELSPNKENAERLDQTMEAWSRRVSGQLGWSDNMVLHNMNDYGKMNAVCYALHVLQEKNKKTVEPVRIRPFGGTFEKPVKVVLSTESDGAVIRYTLDGSEPGRRSKKYQHPLEIQQSCLLRAKAFKWGMKPPALASADFTIGGPSIPRDGLQLWMSADRGVTREGTAAIAWADQSGNGKHAGVAADRAPELIPNRANGLPALRSAAKKYMTLRRLIALKGDCTIIFVASFTGDEGGSIVGDSDDGRIGPSELKKREFSFRFSVGERGHTTFLREPFDRGRFCIWALARRGKRVLIYRDGKTATRRPEYTSAGTTMNLSLLFGMRPGIVNHKGELAELLVYSKSLPDEERENLEGYLKKKYALK